MEWDHLEDDIDDLETQKDVADQQMQENSDDYGKLAELQQLKDQLDEKINSKMERWEYLSQFVN